VILHNPVLNERQLVRLAAFFRGRNFAERVCCLNEIIELGLTALESRRSSQAEQD